jgi:CRISPR/Cas system CSM-associated protein Csm4 (group 5 of RAMP superfamily)
LGGRDRQISEFEASLVYKVSSRIARATQRNLVSNPHCQKKKIKKRKEKKRKEKKRTEFQAEVKRVA